MKKSKKTKREITVGFAYERVDYVRVEASSRIKAIDEATVIHLKECSIGLCHQCASNMEQSDDLIRIYVHDRDGFAEYDCDAKFVRWHIKPKQEKEKEKEK